MQRVAVPIESINVSAYTIPTETPESDGTLEWTSTTLVLVEANAGARAGLGFTYADKSTATLIADRLARIVEGRDAMNIAGSWQAMVAAIRNLGRPGIASMAIAGVDNALGDVEARLLDGPLVSLFGAVRASGPVYVVGVFPWRLTAVLAEQRCG